MFYSPAQGAIGLGGYLVAGGKRLCSWDEVGSF